MWPAKNIIEIRDPFLSRDPLFGNIGNILFISLPIIWNSNEKTYANGLYFMQ